MIKEVLKAKITMEAELEEILLGYANGNARTAGKQSKDFLQKLSVFIVRQLDGGSDKAVLMKLVEDKLAKFKLSLELDDIDDIYERCAKEAGKEIKGFAFSFEAEDVKSIKSVRQSFVWLMGDATKDTQNKVKNATIKAFKAESSRAEVVGNLQEEFAGIINKNKAYFKGVSDFIIRQNQNLSTVNQGIKYDVKYFKVNARLDDKTSSVCRSMHGRVIEASHLGEQSNAMTGARSKESKAKSAAWLDSPLLGKLPKNIGIPPYHFNCRTILLPVYENTEDIDGKKVRYFGNKDKNSIIEHVDKTGVQRKINATVLDKLKEGKHELATKDIISGLNSIKEVAVHKKNPLRSVAKTDNGLYFVFEGDVVVSGYRPAQENTGKPNLDQHFKNNAKLETKKVIKWLKNILSR